METSDKRQRPIPITGQERAVLDEQRKKYEEVKGQTEDWGDFLGKIVLLGLAAAGIYKLIEATKQTPQSANVTCGICYQQFMLAIPSQGQNVVYTRCPHCNNELVVNISQGNF